MPKPFELLKKYFTFPFEPHGFQADAFERMILRDSSLLGFDVGLGKTFTSMLVALYYSLQDDVEQILILCPPILIDQWNVFLNQIGGIPDILVYREDPAIRKKMKLDASVIIASYNIFIRKSDHSKFKRMAKKSKLCIIADELSLKSLKSQTYRKLKMMLFGKMIVSTDDIPAHKLIALNATPISDLDHIYNWCSLFLPGVYGSHPLFEAAHAGKRGKFKKVLEWHGTDLMKEHLEKFMVNTDETIVLPPLVETVTPYHLSKEHMKLYNEVKKSQLDNLPEDKIELALSSMFSTLQKLVLLPSEFGLDIPSPILEYLNGYFDQAANKNVIVYTRHVAVSKLLAKEIPDCGAIFGGVSKKARDKIFASLQDGSLHRLVGNLDSLGIGLNLQMLDHLVYAEIPFRYDKLVQTIGRVHRQGQENTCFANFPIAIGTLQERIYNNLLKNQLDLFKVIKTKDQAREFLG